MINSLKLVFVVTIVAMCNDLHAMQTRTIQLNVRSATTTVADAEITIGDVCDIDGASAYVRDKIASLDLDTASVDAVTEVSRQQIEIRIALADVTNDTVKVGGPESVAVRLMLNETLQQRLENRVANELSRQFGIALNDVQVRLIDQNLLSRMRTELDTSQLNAMVYFSTQLPLGDRYLQLDITDNKGNRLSQRARFQIIVQRDVYVTSGPVTRGTVIQASHIQSIRRPVMDSSVEPAGADCVGCTAIRDIAPHEIVTTRHFSRQAKRKEILVNPNDLVDIVMNTGKLQLRIKNAKVMSRGAEGDTVRVLNTNSNRQINAVVRDRQTVVVQSR